MRKLAAAVIILITSPALANEQAYLAACDEVISGRLPQPKAYRRIASDLTTDVYDRDYVLKNFVPADKPGEIARFDSGEWSPRAITIVVDYEATNDRSEIVKKRSICEFTLPGLNALPEADFVIVDGEMEGLR